MEHEEQHSNKLRILSIGSNAISAFFSWRIQASQAADVTIVWRSQFELVQQHGISFRSDVHGTSRFRPNKIVRTVEEAAVDASGFDYVFVCIKALPDVYKLSEVIRPVVTPSHTCIIVNTTMAVGIEAELMEAFPRNMVLSLCSGIELTQIGPADFDHTLSRPVYVGALKQNAALPSEAQQDMTESLTLTLEAGAVECVSTPTIERYQWEKIIGAIAFHPISVILKEPNHAKLLEDEHIKEFVSDTFEECLRIAEARKSTFAYDFKSRTMSSMSNSKESKSTMYQDFLAGRPLEIEVYLATPIRLAKDVGIEVPRLKSLYAIIHQLNKVNLQKPVAGPDSQVRGGLYPQHTGQSTMMHSRPPVMNRGFTDGVLNSNGGRAMSMVYGPPPTVNGYGRRQAPQPNSSRRTPNQITRQASLEGLEEFASITMYNDFIPSGDGSTFDPRHSAAMQGSQDHAYAGARPQSRQQMTRPATSQGHYSSNHNSNVQASRQGTFSSVGNKINNMRLSGRQKVKEAAFDDDDDEDDYIDSAPASRGPPINPDSVDMLAMTRRGRNSGMGLKDDRTSSFAGARPPYKQSRSSSQSLMNDIPGIHDHVTNSVLFGMGDNRYGTVDSRSLAQSANGRLNSLQSTRLNSINSVGNFQQQYPPNAYSTRQQGPPNAMNGRGPYTNQMPNRNPQQYSNPVNAPRGKLPLQAMQRQQILAQGGDYAPKSVGPNAPPGTRSVTGSASASFGSLGNGSGSHSSSSSRDEIPPPPIAK